MATTSRKTRTATETMAAQTETSSAPVNVEAAAISASGTEVFILAGTACPLSLARAEAGGKASRQADDPGLVPK